VYYLRLLFQWIVESRHEHRKSIGACDTVATEETGEREKEEEKSKIPPALPDNCPRKAKGETPDKIQ